MPLGFIFAGPEGKTHATTDGNHVRRGPKQEVTQMCDVLLSMPLFSSLSSVESGLPFILQVVLSFWMPLFPEIERKYATSCLAACGVTAAFASRPISPCRFHTGEDLENRLVQVFSFTYCICNWRGRGLVVEGCSNVTKLPAFFCFCEGKQGSSCSRRPCRLKN